MNRATEQAPRTRAQVQKDRIEMIAELAKTAFAGHRVEPLWAGVPPPGLPFARPDVVEARAWLCSRPTSSIYSFVLYAVRNRLIVSGDVGTLVLERCPDMLAWARQSIDSIDYFAEKVVREIETEEFDPAMVKGWVAEQDLDYASDERDRAGERWELWSKSCDVGYHDEPLRQTLLDFAEAGENPAELPDLLYRSGYIDGCDYPDFENFTYGFLWCREAIKWFLANHGG